MKAITVFPFSNGGRAAIMTKDSPPAGVNGWQWCTKNALMFKSTETGEDTYITQMGLDEARKMYRLPEKTLDEFVTTSVKYLGLHRGFFYPREPLVINGTPFVAVKLPFPHIDLLGHDTGEIVEEPSKYSVAVFASSEARIRVLAHGSPPPGVNEWQWFATNTIIFTIIQTDDVSTYLSEKGIEYIRDKIGTRAGTSVVVSDLLANYFHLPRSVFYSQQTIVMNKTEIRAVKLPNEHLLSILPAVVGIFRALEVVKMPYDIFGSNDYIGYDVFDEHGKVKP